MDTLIFIIIIAFLGKVLLKKYKPDTYNNIQDKLVSLIKRK